MTKPTKWLCAQRSLRSAWAFAQSDQSLRCPHEESLVLSYPLSAQRRLWSDLQLSEFLRLSENRTKRQTETKACVFWILTTGLYTTEQVQSIFRPEISTHFAHFRFVCKILNFSNMVFMRKIILETVSEFTNLWFKRARNFIAVIPEMKSTERNKSLCIACNGNTLMHVFVQPCR